MLDLERYADGDGGSSRGDRRRFPFFPLDVMFGSSFRPHENTGVGSVVSVATDSCVDGTQPSLPEKGRWGSRAGAMATKKKPMPTMTTTLVPK